MISAADLIKSPKETVEQDYESWEKCESVSSAQSDQEQDNDPVESSHEKKLLKPIVRRHTKKRWVKDPNKGTWQTKQKYMQTMDEFRRSPPKRKSPNAKWLKELSMPRPKIEVPVSPIPGKFQFDNAEERYKTFYALKKPKQRIASKKLSIKKSEPLFPSIDLQTTKSTYSKFELLNNLKKYWKIHKVRTY